MLGCALILSASLACAGDPRSNESRAEMAERVGDILPVVVPIGAPPPQDREAILRELAPLPTDTLLVVYEVEGPGGLTGTLEVLARPGGFRRENWTLSVPLGAEGERRLAGSTIQTPDGVWAEGDPPEAWTPSPLGAVADAYLALDEPTQQAAVHQLRQLRTTLADARAAEPSPDERILDMSCHVTRVATIEMCLWEATGLPLRYESEGLRLRALNIDTRVSIGEHAFDVPFVPVPPLDFDAKAAVTALAEGDLGDLAPLLHPGLRLPQAV